MNDLALEQMFWIDVGALTDIPLRGARRVPAPGGVIAIFRTGDNGVFALRDSCPHKGGPLSQGMVHGRTVTCPLHGMNIDLATGSPTGADAGGECARTVAVRIAEGRILLASR